MLGRSSEDWLGSSGCECCLMRYGVEDDRVVVCTFGPGTVSKCELDGDAVEWAMCNGYARWWPWCCVVRLAADSANGSVVWRGACEWGVAAAINRWVKWTVGCGSNSISGDCWLSIVDVVGAESLSRLTRGCRMSRRPRFGPMVVTIDDSGTSVGVTGAGIGVLVVMNLVANILGEKRYVACFNRINDGNKTLI